MNLNNNLHDLDFTEKEIDFHIASFGNNANKKYETQERERQNAREVKKEALVFVIVMTLIILFGGFFEGL